MARGLRKVAEQKLDAGEKLETIEMSRDDLVQRKFPI
jgi:hypothetical protein